MTPVSRVTDLEKKFGLDILEILYMISCVGQYGGRGPLRPEHIASFLALGRPELQPGSFHVFQGEVIAHIDYLREHEVVSTEPELHVLLSSDESQELKHLVASKSTHRLPLPDLLFYPFGGEPERIPWLTLSSTDSSLNSMLMNTNAPKSSLFVKIAVEPMVFTGVLPVDDPKVEEVGVKFLQRISELEKEGIVRVRFTKLPIPAVSLFPMTTAVQRISSADKHDVARRYFEKFKGGLEESVSRWYSDYLHYYRYIVSRVPDLDMVLGGLMMGKHMIISIDPSFEQSVVGEYISSSLKDEVGVRIEPILQRKSPEELVTNRWLMREIQIYSKERKAYPHDDHPYLQALRDIAGSIRELRLDRQDIDVTKVTDDSLQTWIRSEISEVRSLAETLGLENELSDWLGPIHAYIAYALEEPRSGWRRDGIIVQRFYSADSDKILVKGIVVTKELSAKAIFEQAFGTPSEAGRLLSESLSGLVHFLAEVYSDPYAVSYL